MASRKFAIRYSLVCSALLAFAAGMLLIGFSVTTRGTLSFLAAIDPNDRIDYLAIGLGAAACVVVGASLNLAGECAQSLTRNILASPFTMGITPMMTLSYMLTSFRPGVPVWGVGLVALGLTFALNVLPAYAIGNAKRKNRRDILVFYGLSLAILASSAIALLAFLYKDQNFNVLGWMIIEVTAFSEQKLLWGAVFAAAGAILFFANIKKIHLIEHAYFRAATLNVNVPLLNMVGLVSVALMCVGGFVAYAPFTLLGFAIPYVTKRIVVGRCDVRWSVAPSTLLSVGLTLLAYVANCYLQTYADVVMIVLIVPFVVGMFAAKAGKYAA